MADQLLLFKKKKKMVLDELNESLGVQKCAQKLIRIMTRHIGEDRKITKIQLFQAVYGRDPSEVGPLYCYVMWDIIKRALHLLRHNSRCQVVSKAFKASRYSTKGSIYYFWVADSYNDSEIYRKNLENTVRNIRKAENRMEKSVREGWYKHPELWKI